MAPTFLGEFSLRGKELRSKGINRIGNLLVPNDNYCHFEDWLMPILDKMLEEQTQEVNICSFIWHDWRQWYLSPNPFHQKQKIGGSDTFLPTHSTKNKRLEAVIPFSQPIPPKTIDWRQWYLSPNPFHQKQKIGGSDIFLPTHSINKTKDWRQWYLSPNPFHQKQKRLEAVIPFFQPIPSTKQKIGGSDTFLPTHSTKNKKDWRQWYLSPNPFHQQNKRLEAVIPFSQPIPPKTKDWRQWYLSPNPFHQQNKRLEAVIPFSQPIPPKTKKIGGSDTFLPTHSTNNKKKRISKIVSKT